MSGLLPDFDQVPSALLGRSRSARLTPAWRSDCTATHAALAISAWSFRNVPLTFGRRSCFQAMNNRSGEQRILEAHRQFTSCDST